MMHIDKGKGRLPLPPSDPMIHLQKYSAQPVLAPLLDNPFTVEDVLPLPYRYRPKYDQGQEGACVGFAWSWAKSIRENRYFDAFWLYREAQKIDEWPGENYDGTSVRAGGDVLLHQGHKMIHDPRHDHGVELDHGIEAFRWATSVNEIRASIKSGIPVVLGIEWLSSFATPVTHDNKDVWIGERMDNIRVLGGHAICVYGASDRRQAVKLVNSWGRDYPLVWLPYRVLERLLEGYRYPGEAAILVDR